MIILLVVPESNERPSGVHAGDAPNVSLRFSGLAELGANNDLVL
jgi:hypothetical protein